MNTKQVAASGRRKPPAAGKGRKKGSLNKTTRACKEALQLAFEGIGGVPALIEWSKANQTDFYKLWAKMLPTEIKNEVSGELKNSQPVINLTLTKPGDGD